MKTISVIDSETDPFVYNRIPKPFIWGYYDGKEFKHFPTTKQIIEFISPRDEYIYAHNGGKFDFHFFLKYIPLSKALIINGRIVQMRLGNAILRDSFAILPMALSGYKKDEIDYAKFEASIRKTYMDEIIKYLRGDCVYLHELITAFIAEFGNKVTLASAGLCRAKIVDKISHFKTNRFFYSLFKPYYHGGRVSIFHKGIVKKKTYIYDINSAYPFAMVHEHPFGNKASFSTKPNKISELSMYKVYGIANGAFPYCNERGKLSFPNDNEKREYHVTGYELRTALDTKSFNGKILSAIEFAESISFPKYIDKYYQLKKNSTKQSIPYILAKLAMNSVYGKLAANPDKYFDYVLCAPNKAKEIREKYNGAIVYFCDDFALVAIEIDESRKRFYNVATAASITGYVRAMLWSAIKKVENNGHTVYYCDTDSIITDCPNLQTSNELGDWKLEQENDLLYLYAPKLYAARDAKSHKWKIASKGVDFDHNDIKNLCMGKSVTWYNQAPTFSIRHEPIFIDRTIGRTKK